MRPVRSARAVAVAALALAALAPAGCAEGDKDPTGPGGLGTATITVTGAVSRTVTGNAAFGSGILGMDAFAIVMTDEDETIELGVAKDGAGRLGPGTYSLGDDESPRYGELVVSLPGTDPQFFISETGTLTITSSSASRLRGTISFRGRNEFGSGTVDVTATFDAICLPTAAMTCD